jgi:hypothetical protein
MDSGNYSATHATVSLTVTKPAPTAITWPTPASVSYGKPLSSAQLNARASVPGTFIYVPPAGDVLSPGKHKLSVTFIPADSEKHLPAEANVTLVVDASPNISSLPTPAAHAPIATGDAANYMKLADAERATNQNRNTAALKDRPETRTYKGAIYEKGEDGQWHLQQK